MKEQPTIAALNHRIDAINAQASKDIQALSKIISDLTDENDALMADICKLKGNN